MIAGLPLPDCSPYYNIDGYRKVWELSVPTNKRELRASLGVLDFFRGYHLEHISLMAPLVALLKPLNSRHEQHAFAQPGDARFFPALDVSPRHGFPRAQSSRMR